MPCKGDGDVPALRCVERACRSQLSSWRRQARRDRQGWDDVEKARPEGEGRGSTGQGARARERPAPNVAWLGSRRCWRSKKRTSELLGIPLNPLERDGDRALIVAAVTLRSWRGGLGRRRKPARLWAWLVARCIAGASWSRPKPKRRPRPYRALDHDRARGGPRSLAL